MNRTLFLLPLCVAMATGQSAKALPPEATVVQSSDTTLMSVSDSAATTITSSESDETTTMPTFATIDGDEYILSKGVAYKIKEHEPYSEALHALYSYHSDEDDYIGKRHVGAPVPKIVLPILAIIFGVPCIAIIIIIWLIINYLLKRSRERNIIISKAIDAGYPLPDAFFAQPSARETISDSIGNDTTMADKRILAVQPIAMRDPRKFSSGIKLVGIGLPVFLFFAWSGHGSVAFLCGGILIFIGVAQLISYYCVPGYQSGGYQYSASTQNNMHPTAAPYDGGNQRNNGSMCPPPPPVNRQ